MKLADLYSNCEIKIVEGTTFVDVLGNLNETAGVGKIVKGVNTTHDVGVNEVPKQAAKWGFVVDKNGVPPIASTSGKIGKIIVKK